jgi:hypothetical protein
MAKPGFVYRAIGIIVLLIGIGFLIMGMSYYFDGLEDNTEAKNKSNGTMLTVVCGFPFFMIGLGFFIFGYYKYRQDKPIQDISAILRSYPKINIVEVAKKIGKPIPKTEMLINTCIKKEYVKGYIDDNNYFIHDYTFQGMAEPVSPQFAPRAPPAPIATPQENICPRCGDPLLVDSSQGLYFCPKCG